MAYKATTKLITSLSMWKLSATSANDPTAYPTMISTKKNARSIVSNIDIRADLERPMVRDKDARCEKE
jgi:hypothetical protein